MTKQWLVLFGAWLALSGGGVSAQPTAVTDGALQARFDADGLADLRFDGVALLDADARRPRVLQVRLTDPAEKKHGFQQIYEPKPTERSFDTERRELRLTYSWGWVTCQYAVVGPRLDIDIDLHNGTDKPIQECPIDIFRLNLPHVPANTHLAARREQGVRLCEREGGIVGLRGMDLSPRTKEKRVRLSGPFPPRPAFHPVIDDHWFSKPGNEIPPGETRHYRGSLVCGKAGARAEDLFPELREDGTEEHPMSLKWPDRRPIATIFLCNSATGSKTNPRGWFQANKKIDTTTEEGVEAFGKRLLEYADTCIAQMKEMDAQGVIVWDIEGQQFPHAISYIGDPRALPELAPEMDRFADAFMARFRSAGFRTGVTIRPTEVYQPDPGKWRWEHREVRDPVAMMADKIAYAKGRWGSTIFYMDSNVFGKDMVKGMEPPRNVGWVMPVSMIRALHEKHPDCLIVPEWSNRDYYAYSAPYSSANLRQGGTDAMTRRVWPEAFRVVSVSTALLADRWSGYVDSVRGGDILLFPPWYPAPENTMVKGVYQEAEYMRVQDKQVGDTTALAASGEPAARYAAACRLKGETQAEHDLLTKLLDDTDVAVRRRALESLAAGPPIQDPALLERLLGLFRGSTKDRMSAILRPAAGRALARAGDAAVPHLLPLVDDRGMSVQAVAALGDAGIASEEVVARLRTIIRDDKAHANLREQAIRSVGKLHAESAVPELLETLRIEKRDLEPLRGAAVVALGEIGDKRAVKPLVDHLNTHYSTVVVYWIERALDDSLRKLTGVQGVVGRDEWKRWAKQQEW